MLLQGYNNGEPISREFFDEHISGGHNILLSKFLWPDRDQKWRDDFSDEKEALFRKYAGVTLRLFPSPHPHSIVEYCAMLTAHYTDMWSYSVGLWRVRYILQTSLLIGLPFDLFFVSTAPPPTYSQHD